jgi:tripartite-type tricarboxylate transporter receptor subunit TctC
MKTSLGGSNAGIASPAAADVCVRGRGDVHLLAAELFKRQAKVDMLHVPYKGGGPAVTATLSGEANVYFAPVPPVMHIKAGALRALAVSSPKSLDTLPDYKPIAESGVPGYEFSAGTGCSCRRERRSRWSTRRTRRSCRC